MTRYRAAIVSLALIGLATVAHAQQSGATSDDAITENVKAMIAQRADLKADQITVETKSGVVYLHGMVDTPLEKKDVGSIARQAQGVKKVVNNTSVSKGGGS